MRYPEQGGVCRPGGLGLTRRLLNLSGLAPGSRVLDVGCGGGATLALLEELGYAPRGIDAFPGPCPAADEGDAHALPYGDRAFSGVLMECCLSDFREPDLALSEAARVLEPGGKLLLSDVYARAEAALCPFRVEPWERVEARLSRAGFCVERFEDCSPALKGFWAQLLWERGQAGLCALGFDPVALRNARAGYYIAVAAKGSGG